MKPRADSPSAALREEAVVSAIQAIAGSVEGRSIVLGIGDDAALWQPSRSHRSAITTDMLVEGVHFSRDLMSLEDAGWRAMMAGISDLAAMGARPVLSTIALGFAAGVGLGEIRELYRGLSQAATATKCAIVGGDLSRAPAITIAVTAVGEVRATSAKTRAGGRPGWVLAVTGPLGAARAGLAAASNPGLLPANVARHALQAFRRPAARCREGRFLAAGRNVGAMMDCSDGLSTDLARLCAASNCGAELEQIPVADAARAAAERIGEDPERYALAGGEDFELLVAVAPRAFSHVSARYFAHFKRQLLRIGTLRAGPGIELRGKVVAPSGWDHFLSS